MTSAIIQAMNEAVDNGIFPSGELLVAKNGKVILNEAFGNAELETIFDIASLTKPISTTTLAMQCVAKNIIKLDDPVSHFIKEFKGNEKEKVQIRHLLSHSSGLPAWEPYYQIVPKDMIGTVDGKKFIINEICSEPLAYPTGYESVYSDLGFILLGEIIERVSKKTLDKLFAENIAKPLGLKNTFFIPFDLRTHAPTHLRTNFAPTEHCPWRKKVLKGEVHDQNCYAMGGVAGHAGLFSNTTDINKFITEFVACYKGSGKFLPQEIIERFLPFHYKLTECNTTWLLGWDTPSHANSQAGSCFSKKSIGHLGFTGCSMWIDLEKDIWIVLLTNRIHPTTTNERIRQFRPTLHNIIWEKI